MDVGLWVGEHLHKLCVAAEESFSLENFPEYAACMDPRSPIQVQATAVTVNTITAFLLQVNKPD